eukprot:361279-Chlamydomonas_euryale.AAC.4
MVVCMGRSSRAGLGARVQLRCDLHTSDCPVPRPPRSARHRRARDSFRYLVCWLSVAPGPGAVSSSGCPASAVTRSSGEPPVPDTCLASLDPKMAIPVPAGKLCVSVIGEPVSPFAALDIRQLTLAVQASVPGAAAGKRPHKHNMRESLKRNQPRRSRLPVSVEAKHITSADTDSDLSFYVRLRLGVGTVSVARGSSGRGRGGSSRGGPHATRAAPTADAPPPHAFPPLADEDGHVALELVAQVSEGLAHGGGRPQLRRPTGAYRALIAFSVTTARARHQRRQQPAATCAPHR